MADFWPPGKGMCVQERMSREEGHVGCHLQAQDTVALNYTDGYRDPEAIRWLRRVRGQDGKSEKGPELERPKCSHLQKWGLLHGGLPTGPLSFFAVALLCPQAVLVKAEDIPPGWHFHDRTCRQGRDNVPLTCPPDGPSWGLQVLQAVRQLQGLGKG